MTKTSTAILLNSEVHERLRNSIKELEFLR